MTAINLQLLLSKPRVLRMSIIPMYLHENIVLNFSKGRNQDQIVPNVMPDGLSQFIAEFCTICESMEFVEAINYT